MCSICKTYNRQNLQIKYLCNNISVGCFLLRDFLFNLVYYYYYCSIKYYMLYLYGTQFPT